MTIRKMKVAIAVISMAFAMMGFSGCSGDSSGSSDTATDTVTSDSDALAYEPFINTNYFDFAYGDTDAR